MEINKLSVILLDPYYSGSHKDFTDVIEKYLQDMSIPVKVFTLSGKKWHWRARCGVLQLFQSIPKITDETVLFCSSVMSLSELLGVRQDLVPLKKIVYFHENQLVYPVQEIKSRDIQYSYNQITTCLAADVIIFNSEFNKESFLNNIKTIIKMMPYNKPKNLKELIVNKCKVLYYPMTFPAIVSESRTDLLHIVWPHRWDYDKNFYDFFRVLFKLKTAGLKFKVSVLGQCGLGIPEVFKTARANLKGELANFGYIQSKQKYFEILSSSHVVVSTANHEFFGVAVMEAVYCGCFALLPRKLVYPEIYPAMCLYDTLDDLVIKLKALCNDPLMALRMRKDMSIDFQKYSKEHLLPEYLTVMFGFEQ